MREKSLSVSWKYKGFSDGLESPYGVGSDPVMVSKAGRSCHIAANVREW